MSILPYIKSFADSMKATAQGGVRNESVATYITRPMNQCDGCRVKAPLTARGIHRYSDGSLIGCTRERYEVLTNENLEIEDEKQIPHEASA